MSSIEKIDKNFAVSGEYPEGTVFHDVKNEPFKIYGIYHDGVQYRRLPQDVADSVNEGVSFLARHTAGGRVRFVTDSPFVVLNAKVGERYYSAKMAPMAVSGFDMTTEAAVAKLYYLFSLDLTKNQIKEKMEENLRGELS